MGEQRRRVKILYLVLAVLVTVSVAPLLFYGLQISSKNRERLKTNEQIQQTIVTRSLAEEIYLYENSILNQLRSLHQMLLVTGHVEDVGAPRNAVALRTMLEHFAAGTENILYVTVVNQQGHGIRAGQYQAEEDPFLRKVLERAFVTAKQNHEFHSDPLLISHGGANLPVIVMATPLASRTGDFRGMAAAIVSLEQILRRVQETSRAGLVAYVVDRGGRLVVHPDTKKFIVGQDMGQNPLVQQFLGWQGSAQATATTPFALREGNQQVAMLGTYSAVRELGWGVIAQKPLAVAYQNVTEMLRDAAVWGLLAILVSLVIGYVSAIQITAPIRILAETTTAIAQGDLSQRVRLPSRTLEIAELAESFNVMTDDLERYIERLKLAAEENRQLFLGSIRTLAAAIDEKDPYTRGHSGRVAKYAILIAEAMGLPEVEVDRIRISALLHDVGKIGIDDRVLKKPANLTPDEFEIMKQHPSKGANIIRPVAQLRDMLPGIELHHEAWDGTGYPRGLRSEAIPLMARIIAVADTLDAITTNRPYQVAMDLDFALERIRSLENKRFDPEVVSALFAAARQGSLRLTPTMVEV